MPPAAIPVRARTYPVGGELGAAGRCVGPVTAGLSRFWPSAALHWKPESTRQRKQPVIKPNMSNEYIFLALFLLIFAFLVISVFLYTFSVWRKRYTSDEFEMVETGEAGNTVDKVKRPKAPLSHARGGWGAIGRLKGGGRRAPTEETLSKDKPTKEKNIKIAKPKLQCQAFLKGKCVSSVVNTDRRVIMQSISSITKIIKKLDDEKSLPEEVVQNMMDCFSPNDIATSPSDLLDTLVMYLFLVHQVDWYSDSWRPCSGLTVREEDGGAPYGAKVTGGEVDAFSDMEHDDLVEDCIRDVQHRTKLFLQVRTHPQNTHTLQFVGLNFT